MRILQLAPLWETVPPPGYGGTESVVSILTEQLVMRGHEVALAASGDSRTSARLISCYPRSLRRAGDVDRAPYDWAHVANAMEQADEFDVIHNHAGELGMAFAHLTRTPMLTTTHCLPTPDAEIIWDRYRGAFNTISKAQRGSISCRGPARFVGHVYNAIDVESFPFQAQKGDDLLFLSRLGREKGPQHAIAVARKLGRRLILAGKVDHYDRDFFEEVIRDQIDGEQIVFIGEADAAKKRELFRNARCLLLPLGWEEPFGLVMPEAMACGTPVIAFRRGSAPELIRDGHTGFVVDNVDDMAEAVKDVERIDPYVCREHVRMNFAPPIMTAAYVRAYEELLDRRHWTSSVHVDPARTPASEDAAVVA
jgi:glycosyltransferase involved in cell wall biosynthesis